MMPKEWANTIKWIEYRWYIYMAIGADSVKLVQPTDFEILEVLDEYGRNVAPNIAEHMDRDKNYINNRLPQLADYDLIRKIGPSERSGLYEITDRGRKALEFRERYGEVDDFDELLTQSHGREARAD